MRVRFVYEFQSDSKDKNDAVYDAVTQLQKDLDLGELDQILDKFKSVDIIRDYNKKKMDE